MADNIPKQRHGSRDPIQRAGWVTTWSIYDYSSNDTDEVSGTKAAEAGKTHFVTFITASTDNIDESVAGGIDGGAVKIQLKDGVDVKWEAWVNDLRGNNPAHFAFPAPLQCSENTAISVVSVTPDDARVSVTFGGFTDNGRVD